MQSSRLKCSSIFEALRQCIKIGTHQDKMMYSFWVGIRTMIEQIFTINDKYQWKNILHDKLN